MNMERKRLNACHEDIINAMAQAHEEFGIEMSIKEYDRLGTLKRYGETMKALGEALRSVETALLEFV